MTYSPMRSAERSCSSSVQRLQQLLRLPKVRSPPGWRAEAPAAAAAADAGVAGLGAAADAGDDVAVGLAGGRSFPDTETRCTG